MDKKIRFIVQAGVIGAIYAVLTIVFAPISYGEIQVRISEALTVLPYFTPAAIPGLFIGCIVANIYGGLGIIDIVFGSLATLLAASFSYLLRRFKYLIPLPPVVINAVVVGFILNVTLDLPLFMSMLWVGLGQLIACYGLGLIVMFGLEPMKNKIFR